MHHTLHIYHYLCYKMEELIPFTHNVVYVLALSSQCLFSLFIYFLSAPFPHLPFQQIFPFHFCT
jgi:hypothetical protein